MTGEVIAIDGPGGSGKSTVSRAVAKRLGWSHIDTGAYYRAATLVALAAGVDVADEAQLNAVLAGVSFDQRDGVMLVDGRDVSAEIRTADVTAAVSALSAHGSVRELMVGLQRAWVVGRDGSVVEGRDIGTVVFAETPFKVFLTADPSERARRRAGEMGATTDAVADALATRDRFDSTRDVSPLLAADDAVVIDTTDLGVDQVVDIIVAMVSTKN